MIQSISYVSLVVYVICQRCHTLMLFAFLLALPIFSWKTTAHNNVEKPHINLTGDTVERFRMESGSFREGPLLVLPVTLLHALWGPPVYSTVYDGRTEHSKLTSIEQDAWLYGFFLLPLFFLFFSFLSYRTQVCLEVKSKAPWRQKMWGYSLPKEKAICNWAGYFV